MQAGSASIGLADQRRATPRVLRGRNPAPTRPEAPSRIRLRRGKVGIDHPGSNARKPLAGVGALLLCSHNLMFGVLSPRVGGGLLPLEVSLAAPLRGRPPPARHRCAPAGQLPRLSAYRDAGAVGPAPGPVRDATAVVAPPAFWSRFHQRPWRHPSQSARPQPPRHCHSKPGPLGARAQPSSMTGKPDPPSEIPASSQMAVGAQRRTLSAAGPPP